MKKILIILPVILLAVFIHSMNDSSEDNSPIRTLIIKEGSETIPMEYPKKEPSPETPKLLEEEEDRLFSNIAKWNALHAIKLKEFTKAIWQGDYDLVQSTLEQSRDSRGIYFSQQIPLLNLAIRYPNLVELLLYYGANPNMTDRTTGNTALIEAVRRGYIDSVRILIKKNANPNLKNKQGLTPLGLAKKLLEHTSEKEKRELYQQIITELQQYQKSVDTYSQKAH